MADVWVWRIWIAADEGDMGQPVDAIARVDVTGYDVDAVDGPIGKVDEATYEKGASSLVVDTGWWIFGKKRMLPAGVVDHVDEKGRRVHVRCTRDDVKAAPDYDATRAHEDQYRGTLSDHYQPHTAD